MKIGKAIWDTLEKSLLAKDYSRQNIVNRNFYKQRMLGYKLKVCNIKQCNFTNAILDGSSLVKTYLSESQCVCTIFDNGNLNRLEARDVDFTRASFANTDITRATFVNCDFTGVDFQTAIVDNFTSFENCTGIENDTKKNLETRGATFSGKYKNWWVV